MLAQTEEEEDLRQLWAHANPAKILTGRVIPAEPSKEKSSTQKKYRTIKCVYKVLNTSSSLTNSKSVGDALLAPG
ncbi:unnamed protein product [Dicrocoelium dendriticum]|nr:unnamed protein product [Dicrocoelium dendriticum]